MTDDADSTALAEADTPEDAPAGWAIRTAREADWALEKIGQAKLEMAEIDAQYAAAVERLEARRAQLRKAHERTVEFFTAHLRLWAEPQRSTICSGRRKSKAYIHGVIGWRAKPVKLVVQDQRAFEIWVQDQGHGRAVWVPDMDAVKAEFKVTGVIPPGCDTEGGTDSFYVTTDGE